MTESFADQKFAAKIENVERINRDDARLLKIANVDETGKMKAEVVTKLLESVAAHPESKLNIDYVHQKLTLPGQHVLAYQRNDSILPGNADELPSAFLIYRLFVEKKKKLVAPVDILSSFDSKRQLKNLLKQQNVPEDQVNVQGAGSTALLDLEQFMIQFAEELELESCEIRYYSSLRSLCQFL